MIAPPIPWRAALLAALAVIALLALGYCQVTRPSRDAARQAQAERTLAEARTKAAQDAGAIRDANDTHHQSTRTQVQEAHDEIRRTSDPAERDAAARRRLCDLNPGACAH